MIGLENELVVDLFCGGGGASEGILWGLGRDPDYGSAIESVCKKPTEIAAYHANRREKKWREQGSCWECTAAAEPGRRRCAFHREKHALKERERHRQKGKM